MSDSLPPLPDFSPSFRPRWQGDNGGFTADQMQAFRAEGVAAERAHHSGWFALVMGAAAALEDAANFLRDPDAKRAALGAAAYYRQAALVNGPAK